MGPCGPLMASRSSQSTEVDWEVDWGIKLTGLQGAPRPKSPIHHSRSSWPFIIQDQVDSGIDWPVAPLMQLDPKLIPLLPPFLHIPRSSGWTDPSLAPLLHIPRSSGSTFVVP